MSSERTLPATPRRRERAHRLGLLPVSDGIAWIAAAIVMTASLPIWLRSVADTFTSHLAQMPHELTNIHAASSPLSARFAWRIIWPTALLVLMVAATQLCVRLLLDRPQVNYGRLASFERMHPLNGLRRIASPETLRILLFSLAASIALAVVIRWASADMVAYLQHVTLDPYAEFEGALWLGWRGLRNIMLAAAAITVIQQVFRWRASERRLRMTAEEMRDEQRMMEADPRVRLPLQDTPGEQPQTLSQQTPRQ
jgi:flagellar biosynthesis protein FlhB